MDKKFIKNFPFRLSAIYEKSVKNSVQKKIDDIIVVFKEQIKSRNFVHSHTTYILVFFCISVNLK